MRDISDRLPIVVVVSVARLATLGWQRTPTVLVLWSDNTGRDNPGSYGMGIMGRGTPGIDLALRRDSTNCVE